jgi:hypothetical protein
MRRGLIAWSKAELPPAVFERRIARTQQAMAAAGLDALVLYTNNTRTAGVSWFVGFIPYWSEGLLVIPRRGTPSLVVGLSKRVQFWLERTSHVPVYNAPRVGAEAGRIIAEIAHAATIGVAELENLPTGAADDMTTAAEGLHLVDATALVQRSRAAAEPSEIALSGAAADIAYRALAGASINSTDIGAVIAAIEREARRFGAEEVYIAAAPDLERSPHLRRIEGEAPLGPTFAVRATVAYKGHWVRMVRTVRREDANLLAEAQGQFAEAVSLLPDTRGFADASSWLVEGCRISQPLEPLAGSVIEEPVALSPGALVSVQASYAISGAPILVGGPALIGHGGDAAALLHQRDFDHV